MARLIREHDWAATPLGPVQGWPQCLRTLVDLTFTPGHDDVPAQFQSRADNLAQDSHDRLIFRTTDKTLWFDGDGNGRATALLVADLQAGASLTSADLLLL